MLSALRCVLVKSSVFGMNLRVLSKLPPNEKVLITLDDRTNSFTQRKIRLLVGYHRQENPAG